MESAAGVIFAQSELGFPTMELSPGVAFDQSELGLPASESALGAAFAQSTDASSCASLVDVR